MVHVHAEGTAVCMVVVARCHTQPLSIIINIHLYLFLSKFSWLHFFCVFIFVPMLCLHVVHYLPAVPTAASRGVRSLNCFVGTGPEPPLPSRTVLLIPDPPLQALLAPLSKTQADSKSSYTISFLLAMPEVSSPVWMAIKPNWLSLHSESVLHMPLQ